MPKPKVPAKLPSIAEAIALSHRHGIQELKVSPDGAYSIIFETGAHRKPGGEVGAEFAEEPEPKGPSDKLLYQASG